MCFIDQRSRLHVLIVVRELEFQLGPIACMHATLMRLGYIIRYPACLSSAVRFHHFSSCTFVSFEFLLDSNHLADPYHLESTSSQCIQILLSADVLKEQPNTNFSSAGHVLYTEAHKMKVHHFSSCNFVSLYTEDQINDWKVYRAVLCACYNHSIL